MKKTITIAIFGALLVAYFISCKPGSDVGKSDLIPADGEIPSRESLDQNWSYDESQAFWFTDQGARIMPYDWFVWLEQPDNEQLFRNTAHMEMLGYLPEKSSKWNPAGLPIGFTKSAHNEADQPAALGLTCAACHTSQIDYTKDGKTTKLLVEGAPTLANFNLFFSRLVAAVNKTHDDDAKFKRLADKVLAKGYEEKDLVLLKSEFKKVADALSDRLAVNALPSKYPEDFAGHGRLDAFGEIENAGSAFALNDLTNKNPPAAPVSYPFLWGTHQSDVVQWNASANNRTPIVGPISRNIGEVVGVFGNLQITDKGDQTLAYSSTVNYHGVGALEGYIKKLRSPRWQNKLFGEPDANMVSQGKAIFEKQCASCHQVIAPADEANNYCANRTPVNKIGTDPTTAMQIATHKAKTLILEGQPTGEKDPANFGSESMSIKIPVFGVTGLIKHNLWEVIKADYTTMVIGGKPFFEEGDEALKKMRNDIDDLIKEAITHSGKENYKDIKMEHLNESLMQKAGGIFAAIYAYEAGREKCEVPANPLVYKGRPLNGIWATAPYLHNGSVPNLAELLKAPADRMKTFKVGSRTFDAENVGFITTEGGSTFDTSIEGNSNSGHTYGTSLTEEEKKYLLEYMKTL